MDEWTDEFFEAGGIIKYLVVSWHQNNLVINGISGVGTEEGFLLYVFPCVILFLCFSVRLVL